MGCYSAIVKLHYRKSVAFREIVHLMQFTLLNLSTGQTTSGAKIERFYERRRRRIKLSVSEFGLKLTEMEGVDDGRGRGAKGEDRTPQASLAA